MVRLKGKFALLCGLLSGRKTFVGPAWVVLDVTRRCNSVCLGCFSHCVQERKPSPGDQRIQDLDPLLAKKLSEELREVGTSEVILLGEGEPLLHPSFFEIVTTFKTAGFRTQTLTNGILLGEHVAQRLVETRQDIVNVTFWAVNEKEHEFWHPGISIDALRQRRRGLELFLASREAARSRQPELRLRFPMHRSNIGNLKERVQLVLDSGCDAIEFGYFRDFGGKYEDQCLLPDDLTIVRESLLMAKEKFDSARISHNIEEFISWLEFGPNAWLSTACYAGWYHSSIRVDGTVTPCGHCSLVMGNAVSTSFAEIWNGSAYKAFRKRSSRMGSLAALRSTCDCVNCCNWKDNYRIHRVVRWLKSDAGHAKRNL
jgi:MoaA/NifB/PqqE/SkfB family radical SAM enzyme